MQKLIKLIAIIIFIIVLLFFAPPRGLHGNSLLYYLIPLLILVLVSIVDWYKHRTIDRFLLAIYIYAGLVGIISLLEKYHYIQGNFFASHDIVHDQIAILIFYSILLAIGVYTTFWTKEGFIGLPEEDPQIIRKNSLIMLYFMIAMTCGVIFLPDLLGIWIMITFFIWVSLSRHRITRWKSI